MASRVHIALGVLALFACACNPFKAEVPEMKAGVDAYDQSAFPDAEKHFDEALRDEPSSEGHFDKGASLYQQHKLQDAIEQFNRAIGTKDDALRARAYLDLGNAQAQAGKLEKAVEAYQRALQIAPTDPDARYNLEWALREKEKQQKNGQNGDGQQQAGNDGKDQQQKGDQSQDQKGDKQDEQAKKDGQQGNQEGPQQQGESKDGNQQAEKSPEGKNDQQQQAQNGQPKPGEQQQGDQGKPNEPKDSEKQGDQQQQAQNGQPQGKEGQEPQANAGDRSGGQGGPAERVQPAKPMSRQETAQVLDALQAGEKNLQMWRFQKKDDAAQRNNVDEDW